MKKLFSKIEKFIRLVKKSIYFAWHRHHFLIPPSAMKKYIKSSIFHASCSAVILTELILQLIIQ